MLLQPHNRPGIYATLTLNILLHGSQRIVSLCVFQKQSFFDDTLNRQGI